MTRHFCDRCDADITAKTSGHIDGIADADSDGNGTVSDEVDLCEPCYASFRAFIKGASLVPKRSGSKK